VLLGATCTSVSLSSVSGMWVVVCSELKKRGEFSWTLLRD
jgi:hypothetical protein